MIIPDYEPNPTKQLAEPTWHGSNTSINEEYHLLYKNSSPTFLILGISYTMAASFEIHTPDDKP
jgi:hypothetical protein